MVPVAIGLGSNLGEPVANIRLAYDELCRLLAEVRISSLYVTGPMYVTDQPDFVNAVAVGRTDLPPRSLLARLKAIEVESGRQDGERFGPRLLDLDLLTYGALVYRFEYPNGKTLELPHPRMAERRFVMEPLAEVLGQPFDPARYPEQAVRRLANEDSVFSVQ